MVRMRSGALEVFAWMRSGALEASASLGADALWRVGSACFALCGCALARWRCPLREVRMRFGALEVSASRGADAPCRGASGRFASRGCSGAAGSVRFFAECRCALALWRCPLREVRMCSGVLDVSDLRSADALWRAGSARFALCGCALAGWRCPLRLVRMRFGALEVSASQCGFAMARWWCPLRA
jgi:hypothetical protein